MKKLSQIDTKKAGAQVKIENLPALWKEYIALIRSKGHTTGILGDEGDDALLYFLLPRIKRNLHRLPQWMTDMVKQYGKTARRYVPKGQDPRVHLIGSMVTKTTKEKLEKMAESEGVGVSTIVARILQKQVG